MGRDEKGFFSTGIISVQGVITSVAAGFSSLKDRTVADVEREATARGWEMRLADWERTMRAVSEMQESRVRGRSIGTSTPSPTANSSGGSTAPPSSAGGPGSSGTSPSSTPSPGR